jgi:FkbM family methyltransferase
MNGMAKRTLKGLFASMGIAIQRIPKDDGKEFAPRAENRYKWLRGMGFGTVLDVGGHIGESALQFREILPQTRIYSFEPLGDCFRKLKENLAGTADHLAFNVAIGAVPGKGTIHRSDYSPSSSLLPMADLHKSAYPFSAAAHEETIVIETLDSMAPKLELRGEILLKIDTQGFEKQVIAGAQATLPKVRLIIVETSFAELYRDQARFPEIYRMLADKGFEYRGSWDQFQNPADGMPLQQDAMFLRAG